MTYPLYILWFTVKQAFFSTLFSVPLGFIMARALVWNQPWRPARFCLKLLGLPLITPAIVGILGFITLMSPLLNIYSTVGIILAHVMFYSPFVALLLVNAWRLIPEEHYRLAEQLHFSSWSIFVRVEAPQLQKTFIEASWICFCLFLNSFTTILLLGGGPQKTTLSLALYQSLFFFYDFEQGSYYAGLQLLLTLTLALFTFLFKVVPQGSSLKKPSLPILNGPLQKPIVGITLILITAPLIAIFSLSLPALPLTLQNPLLWKALERSLPLALFIGPLSVGIALCLVLTQWRFMKPLGFLYFILPPVFLGTLLFFLSLELTSIPPSFFLAAMQVLFILPFAFRLINTPYLALQQTHGPTIASLGLSRLQQFSLIEWPLLKKPIATALGLGSALSVGDFPSLAFFATAEQPGISSLLYQQMGYHFDESLSTALILSFFCYLLYHFPQWLLNNDTRTYIA